MKKIILIFLTMFTMACGREEQPKPAISIDPIIAGLLEEFKADADLRGIALRPIDLRVVTLGNQNLADNLMGSCNEQTDWFEIHVRKPESPNNYEFNLRRLAYHEFGHCFLGKAHGGSTWFSIMNSKFFNVKPEVDTWDNLANEFWSTP